MKQALNLNYIIIVHTSRSFVWDYVCKSVRGWGALRAMDGNNITRTVEETGNINKGVQSKVQWASLRNPPMFADQPDQRSRASWVKEVKSKANFTRRFVSRDDGRGRPWQRQWKSLPVV